MTTKNQIWKCDICGNIIEILHEGADSLVCCGQPMNLKEEKTQEQEGKEKHIPIIDGSSVKISTVEHPMTEEHFIEWIEATSESGETCKIFLKPEQKPEATFSFTPVSARSYCNLHGLWESG